MDGSYRCRASLSGHRPLFWPYSLVIGRDCGLRKDWPVADTPRQKKIGDHSLLQGRTYIGHEEGSELKRLGERDGLQALPLSLQVLVPGAQDPKIGINGETAESLLPERQ